MAAHVYVLAFFPHSAFFSLLSSFVLCRCQLFRVDRVVFGAPNPRLGACGGWVDLTTERHPFHEVEVMGGVLAEECALIMREFFRSRRSDEGAAHTEHRPAV